MNRTNIYLTDRQVSELRSMAERSGLSVAELVRRAVDSLIEKERRREKDESKRMGTTR